MLRTLVILAVVTFAAAKIDTICPCDKTVTPIKFNFDEYSKTNGGLWYFAKVPLTPKNSKYRSLKALSIPTKTAGVYDVLIYYKDKAGKTGIFANETVTANGKGLLTAKGKDFVYTLKIYFLKYVPNKYAFYYICGDDGGDTTVDYRYVVSNGRLTEAENHEIYKIDKENSFKGKLIDLSSRHQYD